MWLIAGGGQPRSGRLRVSMRLGLYCYGRDESSRVCSSRGGSQCQMYGRWRGCVLRELVRYSVVSDFVEGTWFKNNYREL